MKKYFETVPVHIVWEFNDETENHSEKLAEEITEPEKYNEGSTKTISVNIYERNPIARRKCIEYYGFSCVVCGFNFEERYGQMGKDFIHVHHLKELSQIGEEYEINPIEDLRPVCPNCHSMLHK
ncbi:HNH endonuclease [Bacillus wiedmannii]|uniref:HNH endonuclease n=1 Tax=Bacillus wiedmannii TaxID=1890302 RepID=UPI0020D23BD9|nr:HNH endonuclease [Bacillus wiedmannii]